jgi:copper homeostasis protein
MCPPMIAQRNSPLFEVCVEGIDGLVAAQNAGADRVELCASLLEGGITPSVGTIRGSLRVATIPFHVIIRPRGGDFLYSQSEFASMLADVAACRELGVAGVVFGCLTADGNIDELRMRELVEAAGPLNVTCHRAFDMTRNAGEALEALVRCGVGRVLTSGQRDTVEDGVALLGRLVEQAAGRIIVMGCGGLRPDNIGAALRRTGLAEVHFAALREVPSGMQYRNVSLGMGGTALDREYMNAVTDGDLVAATIAAARAL